MPDIYKYKDYREFIRDYIEELKEERESFSLRELALRCGMKSHAYLARVLKGTQDISSKSVNRLITGLALNNDEADYFELLVKYSQAEDSEKGRWQEKMSELLPMDEKTPLQRDQYEYYSQWHHAALYCILPIVRFSSFEEIAARLNPRIPVHKVKESIELLKRLELLEETEPFVFKVRAAQITSGKDKNRAIANQSGQMMNLAMEALLNTSPKSRRITGMTMGVSREGVQQIAQAVDEFKSRVAKIAAGDCNEDRVYQLNLQLFPLTKSK